MADFMFRLVINVLLNLIRGSKTFGESYNLRNLIRKSITVEEFEELKSGNKEIIITVSNLSKNAVEYKSLKTLIMLSFVIGFDFM
jgi:hypothetical protein